MTVARSDGDVPGRRAAIHWIDLCIQSADRQMVPHLLLSHTSPSPRNLPVSQPLMPTCPGTLGRSMSGMFAYGPLYRRIKSPIRSMFLPTLRISKNRSLPSPASVDCSAPIRLSTWDPEARIYTRHSPRGPKRRLSRCKPCCAGPVLTIS